MAGNRGVKGSLPIWILSALGVGLSTYAYMHHLEVKVNGFTNAACNINSVVNCDHVAASAYSEVLGLPLACWGMSFYLCILGCSFLFLVPRLALLAEVIYAIFAVVGLTVSIVLAGISIFALKTLCAICVGVYAVNIIQALLVWRRRKELVLEIRQVKLTNAFLMSAALVTLSLGACRVFDDSQQAPLEDIPAQTPAFLSEVKNIAINHTAYSGSGEDYRIGPDSAKIKLITFEDFQCPACQRMSDYLHEIHQEFGDDVQIVYRNFPLNSDCNKEMSNKMHPVACELAILARCAGQVGKFWQYHDLVFVNQQAANLANAKKWAQNVGLDQGQIDGCLVDKSILAKLKDDVEVAVKLSVRATPTVFLNGKQFVGSDIQMLRQEVINTLHSN